MFKIPKDANEFNYDDFDDAGLEDELEAILSGNQPPVNRNANDQLRTNQRSNPINPANSINPVRPARQLPKIPNAPPNLHDLNLNMEQMNLNDDDFDENDPDLNAQLAAICGESLPAYQPKTSPSHQQPNLSNQIRPTRPAPPVESQQNVNQPQSCLILDNSHFVNQTTNNKEQLIKWKNEYKSLALNAKQSNDLDNAKVYLMKMKEIDGMIDNLNNGLQVDLSSIKPPKSINQSQIANEPEMDDHQVRQIFKAPPPASTLLEALEQRRQKIETSLQKEASAVRVRSLTRLLKQYDTAIKANKAGKQFDYASLPELPGFNPLPLNNSAPPSNSQSSNQNVRQLIDNEQSVRQPILPPPQQPQLQPQQPFQKATSSSPSTRQQLEQWKEEFKQLALDAKKNNDLDGARFNLHKMKEVDAALDKLKNGEQIDLLSIDPPASRSQQFEEPEELDQEQVRRLFKAPPPASSLLEALEQRRQKIETSVQKEKAANNDGRVRSLTRLLKQYDTAIKANKAGKQFDYESLPELPGFNPLPLNEPKSSVSKPIAQPTQVNKPTVTRTQPAATAAAAAATSQPTAEAAAKPKPPMRRQTSIANKQLNYLLERQKLFKDAAVEANKKGDTTQALDYLRKSKGFQPLITAVENGLPIDTSNIPVFEGEDDFVMVSKTNEPDVLGLDSDKEEHFRKLEMELEKQINLCIKNRDTFLKLGDVSTSSKFDQYLSDMKKDYEFLRNHKLRNENIPKYHYENKEFSIVVCNTEVLVNELHVEVMRAIDLPCKQPIDSFVKFQFDFPKEQPQTGRTHSFKNSLYPEYNQTFKFTIDRKSRALARVLGKSMKLELYSKGGLFRSDELVGHVNVDLSPLKTKCTIFDSFPLMSGRKEIGGKLTVRVKLREPLMAKQVEKIQERWIKFD